MTSLDQLILVIEDLADNEVDNKTLNYYDEMIFSTNRSIAALNNFVSTYTYTHMYTLPIHNLNSSLQIAALENATGDDVTKEEEKEEKEEKEEGLNTGSHGSDATEITPTDAEPTDSPLKNKMVRLKQST